MGEAVRLGVELPVGQLLVSGDDRDGLRGPGCLFLEQGVHARLGRIVNGRVVAQVYELVPFGRVEYLGPVHRPVRIGDHGVQQPHQTVRDGLGARGLEDVGGEFQGTVDPVGRALRVTGLAEREGQVELGHASTDRLALDAEPRQLGYGAQCVVSDVVEGEHDLEEGVVGEGAGGVEVFDEAFEGEVLVGVGVEVGFADAVEEFAEGGLSAGVGAQDEGVDEEADEVVGGVVGATGDIRADGDVRARAEAGEEGGQGGLEHHEDAGVRVLGDVGHATVQRGRDGDRDAATGVGGGGGVGSVGGEFELLR